MTSVESLIADMEAIDVISAGLLDANALKVEAANLTEVESRIAKLEQTIVSATRRAIAVQELGCSIELDRATLSGIRALLMAENDGKPAVLKDPVGSGNQLAKADAALAKQSREASEEKYRDWFDKKVGDLDGVEVLAAAIGEVDIAKGASMRMHAQKVRGWRRVSVRPGLGKDIEEALTQIKELEKSVAPDDETRAFLEAVTGNGATLDMMSDHVKAWLESKGLLGSLRVRLGSSNDGE